MTTTECAPVAAPHAIGLPPPVGPAARVGPAAPVAGSLSPSRASDFMSCPLRYRFRTIDRLAERPTPAAVRGTLVHAVLERLFDLPAPTRTLPAALALVRPEWQRLRAAEPELATLFEADEAAWLASADGLVAGYFELEDPALLMPAEREYHVETVLADGLRLRGYVDRLDRGVDGELRIVDYKTGRVPREAFEARALFQMKFYALVLWRMHGAVPRLLQLMYLGDREVLRYAPDEADLLAVQRKLTALWTAIERATATGDWRPNPGPLCQWCDHQSRCPAFGGTPPPLPGATLAP